MLTICIDDGGKHGPPAFVVAGYAVKREAWYGLADRWQKVLKKSPKLDYFKTEEAFSKREQFQGWTDSDRDARVFDFARVADESRLIPIKVVIPTHDFENVFQQNRGPFKEPCNLALLSLFTGLMKEMDERDPLNRQEIELFFDYDCFKPGKLEDAYRLTLEYARQTGYADLASLIPEKRHFAMTRNFCPYKPQIYTLGMCGVIILIGLTGMS